MEEKRHPSYFWLAGLGVVALIVIGASLTLAFQNGSFSRTASIDESLVRNNSEQTTEQTIPGHESGATEAVSGSTDASSEEGPDVVSSDENSYLILKDVGEPQLDRFGLAPSDFKNIKAAGVDIISVNFDICAPDSNVIRFLDSASDTGLKVIMPAGSGEAEWGYPCEGEFSDTLKPSWQKERVEEWVEKWAYHPAIYAWDISNEAGQNFPNAQKRQETWIQEGYALTLPQLQQAYKDVKEADPTRPVLMRMNGWFFYDYDSNFFRSGNPYGKGVADIVMVNAYSNVQEFFDDMVETVAERTHDAVLSVNPVAKIIVAVGAWKEAPMWYLPSAEHFKNDVAAAETIDDLLGVAVFKYGAEESDWWMPRDANALWDALPTLGF